MIGHGASNIVVLQDMGALIQLLVTPTTMVFLTKSTMQRDNLKGIKETNHYSGIEHLGTTTFNITQM